MKRVVLGSDSGRCLCRSVYSDFLLLEVPAVFFINEHQIQIVFHTELVVDIAVGRCQFIWAQEQPDWDRLP